MIKVAEEFNVCNVFSNSKSFSFQHVQNIHRDMVHKCQLCGETFNRISDLFAHEKMHRNNGEMVENEVNLKCTLCDITFETRPELLAHRRSLHAVSDSHLCYLCGKGFKKIYSLNLHLARHSSDQAPPHLCTECGKSFRVRRNLNIHMKIHSGNQPFTCEHCHEGFFQRQDYDNHVQVHLEERPHVCTVCGKRFKLDLHLKTHFQRLHMGDKPFKCKWEGCKMSFTTKISLSKVRKKYKNIIKINHHG
jgi:KRAB domain-containing zinc finger protein